MNPVTFSTLACPGWSIRTVIERAAEYGYDGIEWRGGPLGHLQPGMPESEKADVRSMSDDAGLFALAVTAYTSFVSPDAAERQSNIDELRRYADLAAELGATYVRAFLGELPESTKIDSLIYRNISKCLNAASRYAASVGVTIAVEPHDNFARSSLVFPVLEQTGPRVRVIWDIGNTFAIGEEPREGFPMLRDRLAYVQVKDGTRNGSQWQLSAVGKGNVPLRQAFEMLIAHGYEDALSVEWEYAWHPELDPPEVALPAALRTVRELLAAANPESA